MSLEAQGTAAAPRQVVAPEPGDEEHTGTGGGAAPLTARLTRLVEGFNRARHPDEIVQAMLDDGVELLGGRTASLHLLSESGDELIAAGDAGLPPGMIEERFGRIPLSSALPAAEVIRTGQPVAVASAGEQRERYPDLDSGRAHLDPTFVVLPLRDAAGRPFGAMGVGFADGAEPGGLDRALFDYVAAQCALALDRARLAVATEQAQETLVFLDALSGALASNLDLGSALGNLAGMTVPRLADWCVVRLASSPGSPQPLVGAAHVDESQVGALRRVVQRLRRNAGTVDELGAALAAGRPLIRGARAADMVVPLLDDPDDHAAMAAIGVDSLAVFPLKARGRLLGVIAFGNRPGRRFQDTDVDLATAVASRAAVIVDNARLFHEQAIVARALQDSLLPGRLPDIPGMELGARYRAAGQGLDVGGDFYDAFRADQNWWIFAVGDVCGHGVEAAATTGLVRHTIRSSAYDGVMPSTLLRRLNDMLMRSAAERGELADDGPPMLPRYCTVLLGAVQPTTTGVDIVLCAAGHPLPMVRRVAGRVEPVGVPGTLLGITDDVSLVDAVVHLDPGESLVCYTDGLSDRRSGRRTFGEEGIVKAILQGKRMTADELARHVEAEALGFVDEEPADDMAVLALRAAPR
jgi:serine phosphatase RsbU (regulator of sigma subunit)